MTDKTNQNWLAGATWHFSTVFKQTNAGGGNITVAIIPGEGNEFILMGYHIGKDDYAAGRTVSVSIRDVLGNFLMPIDTVSVDNQDIYGPPKRVIVSTTVGSTVGAIGLPDGFIFSGTDKLVFNASSLVQNEELTIDLRLRIKGVAPTVDDSDSTGTVTQSGIINKVI